MKSKVKCILGKIHNATGNDDLRPVFFYVLFSNGYAYATDGHIIVKQKFSLIFNDVLVEGVENLNGKAMHAKLFEKLLTADFLKFDETGVLASYSNYACKYDYSKLPEGRTFESWDKVINEALANAKVDGAAINAIGINPKIANRLYNCLVLGPGMTILHKYQNPNRAIVVTAMGVPETEQVALLMPVMITD